ncbi:MAG: sialidase family protein [Bacteroidota bacterium]
MLKKLIIAGLILPLLTGCNQDENSNTIPKGISDIKVQTSTKPLIKEKSANNLINITLIPGQEAERSLSGVEFSFDQDISGILKEASISTSSSGSENTQKASTVEVFNSKEIKFSLSDVVINDTTTFHLNLTASKDIKLASSISIKDFNLTFDDESTFQEHINKKYRPAMEVRAAGQDKCDTYRIPGLVTTNEGTLIAVYDNRYTRSKDLQEHIDVGMSRSTDGGETWEPMKVIMDKNEWGGEPEYLNGVGDPAVLYDDKNNTIWVAALWLHGFNRDDMAWWASQPGMKPSETGQFLLTKSTDDGKTWSDPINITEQIKDPDWQLLLQGPGKGITLNDGTLVFPAQFKADIGEKAIDGHQYTPHSTIIYSKDGGEKWEIGTGAKPNTTEAQVVQLSDGSLMLNMRDDRNRKTKDETNGRAVATTNDLGETWETHPSSNSALPEPNCMASLISADLEVDGKEQKVLFFSNPADKHDRINMTIKASLDEGMTWPEEHHVLLREPGGFGYSCMTMVDDEHVGILYEGVKNMIFQKVPVDEILTEEK